MSNENRTHHLHGSLLVRVGVGAEHVARRIDVVNAPTHCAGDIDPVQKLIGMRGRFDLNESTGIRPGRVDAAMDGSSLPSIDVGRCQSGARRVWSRTPSFGVKPLSPALT